MTRPKAAHGLAEPIALGNARGLAFPQVAWTGLFRLVSVKRRAERVLVVEGNTFFTHEAQSRARHDTHPETVRPVPKPVVPL